MLPGAWRKAGVIGFAAACVAGCGLAVGGTEISLSPSIDGGTVIEPTVDGGQPSGTGPMDGAIAIHDAGPQPPNGDAAMPAPPGPDGSVPLPPTDAGSTACLDPSGACLVVPAGWQLVAFASAQSSPCPAGFDSAAATDLVEGPTTTGTCSCGACTVSTPPTCGAGTITAMYDYAATVYGGTCYLPATGSPLMNSPAGGCGTDAYQGVYSSFDMKYVAPPASGGTCSAPGVAKGGGVKYAAQDRVCTPNSDQAAGCVGDMCQPNLPAGYDACIAYPGAVACPPGPLSVGHLVGTSGSVACPDCPCTISATCSGTVTLYTDTKCTKGGYAIATGSCVGVASDDTYDSYDYQADAPKSVTCKASAATGTANVSLSGEQTICCTQ
jgi:hypothetical protein